MCLHPPLLKGKSHKTGKNNPDFLFFVENYVVMVDSLLLVKLKSENVSKVMLLPCGHKMNLLMIDFFTAAPQLDLLSSIFFLHATSVAPTILPGMALGFSFLYIEFLQYSPQMSNPHWH